MSELESIEEKILKIFNKKLKEGISIADVISEITDLDLGTEWKILNKSTNFLNKLEKIEKRYSTCRKDTSNTKLFCGVSSGISLATEHVVESVGINLMIGGGKMITAGIGGSVETMGATFPLVASGAIISAAGYYTTMKSEKIGEDIFDKIINKYGDLKKETPNIQIPDTLICVSAKNEFYKIDMKNRNIILDVGKEEAYNVVMNSLENKICKVQNSLYENRLKLKETKRELETCKTNLDFQVKHEPIQNIDKPLEDFDKTKEVLDLSYETIINYQENKQEFDKKSTEILNKKIVYKPHYSQQDLDAIRIGGTPQIRGGGGSGGGWFVVVIPVVSIPLSGGCVIL
jgi:hypothetical protein